MNIKCRDSPLLSLLVFSLVVISRVEVSNCIPGNSSGSDNSSNATSPSSSVGPLANPVPRSNTSDVIMTFGSPVQDDGALANRSIVLQMDHFQSCMTGECFQGCGTKNSNKAYCDPLNKKLCMCSAENFYSANLEGTITPVDRGVEFHRNCSIACNKRFSYARIWTKTDGTLHCGCLMNQVTPTGITLCDEFAIHDPCQAVCQTEAAVCTFNGVCLCKTTWAEAFYRRLPNMRKERPDDKDECSIKCANYHHDYTPRMFDSRMDSKVNLTRPYKFTEKFCLCGPELDLEDSTEAKAFIGQGFQMCTGLKCKQRCGMDDAQCEPIFKRTCLCNREKIQIGEHLWSRLPSHEETKCYETCLAHGLDARVIEWNPFFKPTQQVLLPIYRKTEFRYIYDGKFCHCIQVQQDMHQYRPCTDALCHMICGHHEATCDLRTRRACMCNTHQLVAGLGRRPDPGEINCDIACRFTLTDARILDMRWEIPVDNWGVKISKYCACVRPVSQSGLTHCDPLSDECPSICNSTAAFCTREKYCHCGIKKDLLNNPLIRLGNGKEQEECGETCRSWSWPIAEDLDNLPFIYDESLAQCLPTDTCPVIDTSPWVHEAPGAMETFITSIESKGNAKGTRRMCLCAKSNPTMDKPGSRFLFDMSPVKPTLVPCVRDHICAIINNGLHIIA